MGDDETGVRGCRTGADSLPPLKPPASSLCEVVVSGWCGGAEGLSPQPTRDATPSFDLAAMLR